MHRIRLDGITISFYREVCEWWETRGGNSRDIELQSDHVILNVPPDRKPKEIEELLQKDAPAATYLMVFPVTSDRPVPLLVQGPSFDAENTRRSWASGPNTPLSAIPAELRRAKPPDR